MTTKKLSKEIFAGAGNVRARARACSCVFERVSKRVSD